MRKCTVAAKILEGGAYFVRIGRVVVQHAGRKMINVAGGFIELLFEPFESGCREQALARNKLTAKTEYREKVIKKCAGLIFTGN